MVAFLAMENILNLLILWLPFDELSRELGRKAEKAVRFEVEEYDC